MIAYKDIIQGSEEWHKIKHGKIGGTLSKGLFVKSDTLLIDLLSQITEPFEMDYDTFESAEMQRGNELEPLARQQLNEYTGLIFLQFGWLECEENKLLGISPDGLTECQTISAEIKCPQAKKHMATLLLNDIPSDNIHQCLHYFTVNPKLVKHYFCSFRPESIKPLFVKLVDRSTVINLGTKTKPINKTIQEWVNTALFEANVLRSDIEDKIKQLSF